MPTTVKMKKMKINAEIAGAIENFKQDRISHGLEYYWENELLVSHTLANYNEQPYPKEFAVLQTVST